MKDRACVIHILVTPQTRSPLLILLPNDSMIWTFPARVEPVVGMESALYGHLLLKQLSTSLIGRMQFGCFGMYVTFLTKEVFLVGFKIKILFSIAPWPLLLSVSQLFLLMGAP